MQIHQTLCAAGSNRVKQQELVGMLITIIGRMKFLPHCKVLQLLHSLYLLQLEVPHR